MNLLRTFDDLPAAARGGAVSIGNFDGVHRGHAQLIGQLCAQARRCAGPAVVFTFEPHPAQLLRPDRAPPPLNWLERKGALLAELGVDWVVAYPTDRELLSWSPEQFFQRIVRDGLGACAMVEGPNFYFGKNRTGDIATLREFCRAADIELEIAQPQQDGQSLISSSRIRHSLEEGDVKAAAAMLGRPHRIRGLIERGAERGRGLGYPTANLGQVDCLAPADGVYACRAFVGGLTLPAAVNLGSNPTFAEAARKVEAHLLDFDQDVYGESLELDFLARLRGVRKFDSVEALQNQLTRDAAAARTIATDEEGS